MSKCSLMFTQRRGFRGEFCWSCHEWQKNMCVLLYVKLSVFGKCFPSCTTTTCCWLVMQVRRWPHSAAQCQRSRDEGCVEGAKRKRPALWKNQVLVSWEWKMNHAKEVILRSQRVHRPMSSRLYESNEFSRSKRASFVFNLCLKTTKNRPLLVSLFLLLGWRKVFSNTQFHRSWPRTEHSPKEAGTHLGLR